MAQRFWAWLHMCTETKGAHCSAAWESENLEMPKTPRETHTSTLQYYTAVKRDERYLYVLTQKGF